MHTVLHSISVISAQKTEVNKAKAPMRTKAKAAAPERIVTNNGTGNPAGYKSATGRGQAGHTERRKRQSRGTSREAERIAQAPEEPRSP